MNYIYKNYKVMGVKLGVEADHLVAIKGWEHISADEHCRLNEVIGQRDDLLKALEKLVDDVIHDPDCVPTFYTKVTITKAVTLIKELKP